MDNAVFNLVQMSVQSSITSSTTLTTFSGSVFTFHQQDQYASLGTVFDQYRIAMVEWTALPRVNVNDQAAVNTGQFGSVVDYDDATALTMFNQVYDYTNAVVTEGYRQHQHVFVPHIAVAAFSGAFTSYENVEAPWIDCGSPDVQHYGVKTAWMPTTSPLTYDIRCRVWFQFRNVR
jgi:hypothetical protein